MRCGDVCLWSNFQYRIIYFSSQMGSQTMQCSVSLCMFHYKSKLLVRNFCCQLRCVLPWPNSEVFSWLIALFLLQTHSRQAKIISIGIRCNVSCFLIENSSLCYEIVRASSEVHRCLEFYLHSCTPSYEIIRNVLTLTDMLLIVGNFYHSELKNMIVGGRGCQ